MNSVLCKFLFTKSILVADKAAENPLAVLYTVASNFNIRFTEGEHLVSEEHIQFIASQLGYFPPLPFYRGFPETARELSADKLAFDQFVHYAGTYGFGDFSHAGHSIFEGDYERLPFSEYAPVRDFKILTEEEAVKKLTEYVEDMLVGTRPLNDMQFDTVKCFIGEYNYELKYSACKATVIRLLADTRELRYAEQLWLSDVIKLTEQINYSDYGERTIKKLNLKNRDRKFIAAVMDLLFEADRVNVKDCYEKKALWCGLLHHIHYKAKCAAAEEFLDLMRGKGNSSVYSLFERAMERGDIPSAVEILKHGKGSSAILRNLNYILSRCKSKEDIEAVTSSIDTNNAVILIQLMLQYASYKSGDARTFKFTKYNKMIVHKESEDEVERRRSVLPEGVPKILKELMEKKLTELLAGRLGKVYISPDMYNIAVPVQENTSQGGYGVLPKGSRIPLDVRAKKIRAFTYWEKVNDIDLSVIGLDADYNQYEFSWRTMYGNQSDCVTYSGDQTSGYNGGSEYFDINIRKFKKNFPKVKKLIFCNNVFSASTFDKCICRAGYMLRDIKDSGEVFEPKTVKSSFRIDCQSTFAYLFGIDLSTNEFVWLNVARESNAHIAGMTSLDFIIEYFNATSVINLGKLAEMLASETVSTPEEAETVFSDETLELSEGQEQIRPCDIERINALINSK